MKIFTFHLMPYAHLDVKEAEKYRAVWVVLPNTFYDPKKGSKLYQEYIDQLVFAAKCGLDGICVNEHHQNAYGIMPSPVVTAAGAVTAVTLRSGAGVGVIVVDASAARALLPSRVAS